MTRPHALLKLLAGLIAGMCLAAPLASRAAPAVVKVDLSQGPQTQALSLPVGRSAVVDLPVDARDVLVSNPNIAEAVLRSPRRIYVLGLKSGATDAVFFDQAGRRILSLNIRVDQNTSQLSDTINRLLPGSQVRVEAINDSVVLSGTVASESDADKAMQLARASVSTPDRALNMLSIAGKDQVMLKVRVLEMNRTVIKQLGFDWQAIINKVGSTQFLLSSVPTFGVNGALLGGAIAGLSHNTANDKFTGEVQAFEQVGLVRTLAEPNLTAVSGEPAKFLVGGEFPVPSSVANNGQVSVEFKPFGVGLGFTPIVLSGGRISLKLATEVSELSNQGSFNVSTGSGGPTLVIPSLTVRRAETTVELPSGGALMIAGLLQDKTSQDLGNVPGIKNVPILGALFQSRDFQSGQTELVVIVTPYIVNPTSPDALQSPTSGLEISSDADTILLGRLNKTYNHPPEATVGRTYKGPYGYVVE